MTASAMMIVLCNYLGKMEQTQKAVESNPSWRLPYFVQPSLYCVQ